MKLNTLLNLQDEQEVEYMHQTISITYNGVEAEYVLERDNDGNMIDVIGCHEIVKQIDNQGHVTIANVEELVMDKLLDPVTNYDYDELQYLVYEMYVDVEEELTCRIIHPEDDYKEEDITFTMRLIECVVMV